MENYEDSSSEDETNIRSMTPAKLKEKFLDFIQFDNIEMSEKMTYLLLEHGDAISVFMNFITRLNPELQPPSSYVPGGELPFRARNMNEQETKISYNCMDILCSANKNLPKILQTKFREVVVRLFDIFKYNSDGNFHHFRKVFENLLRFKPIEILDIILTPRESEPPLVLSMLDFIDESPVSAALGTILFFPLKLSTSEMERKKRINHFLESQQLIGRIVKRIGYSDNQSAAASDFLVRVIDECTRIESSEVITSSMRDINNSIVEWVFEIINSKDPKIGNTQRFGCFNVLNSLLVKSSPREFEIPVNTQNMYAPTIQKTPNGLHDLNEPTKIKVIQQFKNIYEILHNESYSTRKGKDYFPAMRLSAMEVMCEALKDVEDVSKPLDLLPAAFWKMLINWFFEFKFNNVYHSCFYKLVIAAIRSNHVSIIQKIFSKTKFLSRMIEHYQDKSVASGCRGFILLMCNVLRLTNDSQKPNEYIPTMLSSHHSWNNFLLTLRQDTLAQVSLQVEEDPTFTRPMPHTGPQISPLEEDELMSFLARVLKSGDIDIGSQFAYSLGFTGSTLEDDEYNHHPVQTETKKKKKKNKKTNNHHHEESTHENGEENKIPDYQPPPPYKG